MAHQQFGTTWWGEKWLDALQKIDSSSRLPRGKAYARKGAVQDVHVKDTSIFAKVQGSQRSPYRVTISLEPLSHADKKTIIATVNDNPLIMAKLLNKQLPSELFDVLTQKGISLFAKDWSELQGSCSCPDWAVPCKHLAAVIFAVANLIDQRPQTVFALRGLDLFSSFTMTEKSSVTIPSTPIPQTSDWLIKKSRKITEEQEKRVPPQLPDFDLSTIPELGEKLVSVLSDHTPFNQHSSFKNILKQTYQMISSGMTRILELQKLMSEYSGDVPRGPRATLSHSGTWQAWELASADQNLHPSQHQWIGELPLRALSEYDRYVNSWVLSKHVAEKLLVRGAVLPRVVAVSQTTYRIQWIPAQMSPQVAEIIDLLCEYVPDDVLSVKKGKSSYQLVQREQVYWLLGIWFDRWIGRFAPEKAVNSHVGKYFFKQELIDTAHFEHKHLPDSVQSWLQRWHLSQREWLPAVQIEDSNDSFSLSIYVKNMAVPLATPVPLDKFLSQKKYQPHAHQVLQDCAQLAEQLPEIASILSSGGAASLSFDPVGVVPLLIQVLPTLKLLQIPLILPKGLDTLLHPKLSPSISTNSKNNRGFLKMEEMLKFEWQVAIGKHAVSTKEFEKLVKNTKGVIRFRDEYVYLDPQEIARLLKTLEKPESLSQTQLLHASLSGENNGATVQLTDDARSLLESLLSVPELPTPKSIHATLRPYQQRGWSWLYHNARLGFGSLLADDMGLGKTLQIITVLTQWQTENKFQDSPALIVVPTTLLTNWRKELEKFAPNLTVHIYHGTHRSLPTDSVDVILTTYGHVRKDSEILHKQLWAALILDEAQNIKNYSTNQARAVRLLKSHTKIGLTGTPVENHLSEYWSIFEFLNPGYLGSEKEFQTRFARPIEVDRNQSVSKLFKKISQPFMYRRLKSDKSIIADLPDKIVIDQYCDLTKTQAVLYQSFVDQCMKVIEESESSIERAGLVFKLMTGLKQICNHPAHFLKQSAATIGDSGKLKLLIDLLSSIKDSQQKTLLFTQYTQMGILLSNALEQGLGKTPLFFHGGLSRKVRDEIINTFQEVPQENILIISLKAGGTGLNLTRASQVIHYDLWWNPAVEDQATDRAYRIGQTQQVNVHRLITSNTFEEKVNLMIQKKRQLANDTVSTGEKWLGELSNQELKELFALGR